MNDRLLTPSKISAWLECAHSMTLEHRLDAGELIVRRGPFGAMARLLMDKGLEHEAACLEDYEARGLTVFRVPPRFDGESFAGWVARIGNPLVDGHDVIFQMPFVQAGVRGIADFLVRTDRDDGTASYEPVDAKLSRSEAKPGHVLQLCFYADAIEALTGARPELVHIWLGSGRTESIRLADVHAYWRRLRHQLADLLLREDELVTRAEPCAHCPFCMFADHCDAEWRAADSLVYVAGVRAPERAVLEGDAVTTLAALAALDRPVSGIDQPRQERLVLQAELQVVARAAPEAPPPFAAIAQIAPDGPVIGLAALPEPDPGDVFLDYEGHPFWRADKGLFFLFGLLTHDGGPAVYQARWAHDDEAEAAQTLALINDLVARQRQFPGMHVYHYNHTERSALERLASQHGVGEHTLAGLVDGGLFVDLLAVVRHALVVGVESYGLKSIERLTAYVRSHEIDQGAGAVVEYEAFTDDGDSARLARIAVYNEDDVRATLALRDWLVARRPDGLAWRLVRYEPPDDDTAAQMDAQVVALHAFGSGSVEHLLGDLLGYWRREWRVTLAGMLAKASQEPDQRLADPDVLAALEPEGLVQRTNPKGKPLTPAMRLRFPPQPLSTKFSKNNASTVYDAGDGLIGFASFCAFDRSAGTVELTWGPKAVELGVVPSTLVLNDWVPPKPKPQALSAVATAVLATSGVEPRRSVSESLLCRQLPRFSAGHGPADGYFTDDLSEILGWSAYLDHSFVAIQGPPGTGKTYTGAHIVHELVRRGRRVGITAMSHGAIDNLLGAVTDVFAEAGDSDLLRAARRHRRPREGGLPGVTYVTDAARCASGDFNVIAGTTWVFANEQLRDDPVDVLLVDEAGQLALADALAASTSARNVILLGDPSQLAQVSQAAHRGGSGASVLEHVLGDDLTIPDDRGVFLSETRRMHPDITAFISDQIYGGRLQSHPSCALQGTEHGTGLRWIRAHHEECSTQSAEEAELVHHHVAELIGSQWTDASSTHRPIGPADVMVVAPYNDQVNLLRTVLDADPHTHGVRVGTVDKFQGQEAPVVFFTMTTSTAAHMPRSLDFLFSKNRLNVAISRARCLAYLVCTDALLDSRARDVEQMKLIATLCSFVEWAAEVRVRPNAAGSVRFHSS